MFVFFVKTLTKGLHENIWSVSNSSVMLVRFPAQIKRSWQ